MSKCRHCVSQQCPNTGCHVRIKENDVADVKITKETNYTVMNSESEGLCRDTKGANELLKCIQNKVRVRTMSVSEARQMIKTRFFGWTNYVTDDQLRQNLQKIVTNEDNGNQLFDHVILPFMSQAKLNTMKIKSF